MRKKILSVLMIMLLSIVLFNTESIEASNYNQKIKSVELVNYYDTATDHTDSDVLFGSSNYIGESDVEGVYEYGVGKNLINFNNIVYDFYLSTGDGNVVNYDDGFYIADYYEVLEGEDYTISHIEEYNNYCIYYDINFDFVTSVFRLGSDATCTIPSGVKYMRLSFLFDPTGDNFDNLEDDFLQLEVGNTATSYEPYTGLQRVSGVTDLTDTLFNDTQYDNVSYIDSLDVATDYYQGRTLRQVFGDSIYGVGRTNLIANGDFSDGVTGWNTNGTNIISVVSGVGKVDYVDDALTLKQSITFNNTNDYYFHIGFYDSDLGDRGYYYIPIDGTDFTIFPVLPVNDFSIIFETDVTGLYTVNIGRAVYVDGTYIELDDVMLYDLTALFDANYLPTIEQFENLIDTYDDVTANGEGVYQQYASDTKQDDYTYVKLINISDTHFEFNLTETFGVNIPDIEELDDNLVYDSVNDKYYYNVVTTDTDIIKLDCQYTATNLVVGGVMSEAKQLDHIYYSSGQINSMVEEGFIGVTNLITNGDFSDGYNNWTPNELNTSEYGVENEVLYFTKSGLGTSTMLSQPSLLTTNDYYLTFESISNSALVGTGWAGLNTLLSTPSVSMVKNSIIWTSIYDFPSTSYRINDQRTSGYDRVYIDNVMIIDLIDDFNVTPDISVFEDNYLNGVTYIDGFSSDIVIDLTALYGRGNEPTTAVEFEAVTDLSSVSATYTVNDSCNVSMSENNAIYQYEKTLEDEDANINLTFVDTVYGVSEGEIEIVVEKYDLNMNYLGILSVGRVTNDSDLNSDGFLEHNYSFFLPMSTALENGYIYQVKNGVGGKLLTAGYYYDSTGNDFTTLSSGIRDSFNAVGINDTVYNDTDNTFLFDPETPLDYLINDAEEFIFHYRYEIINPSNLIIYNENSTQSMTINLEDIYSYYNDVGASITNDGYFVVKASNDFPMLLQYLYDNGVYDFNINVSNAYDYYNSDLKGLFNDIGYADNYGVYTYEINDGTTKALGESPIYFMNSFNSMTLNSHLARAGNPFIVKITQPHTYLGDVYDNQYVYDANTLVSNFDLIVNGDAIQDIYIDMFQGLGDDTGIIRYYLTKTFDYKNGADNLSYTVYLEDTYNLKVPNNLAQTRDNMLDQLGLNSTFGKVLISIVLIIIVAVFVYVKSNNSIVTMITSFLMLGLMFVLGFIEAWVILFVIIIILLIVYFVYSKTSV